jgi:VWFA-related protein
MKLVNEIQGFPSTINRFRGLSGAALLAIITLAVTIPGSDAQSSSQQPANPPAQSQPAQPQQSEPNQDIPDAPSTVQPPTPKPAFPAPSETDKANMPAGPQNNSSSQQTSQPQNQENPAPPPMKIQTVPAGTVPRNQVEAGEDLYKIVVQAQTVQIPVTVKYSDGRRVEGLRPNDFTVLENGQKQTLTFFTSDPFQLSVAILLDTGMPDVALQKVNQTYSSLVGAFSPYDEYALYTYSSTVTQQVDFTSRSERLESMLNQMKLVRGHPNGPPEMGGPMTDGPIVNGAPVGGPVINPVYTPPKEAHVLNDAILQAALDLSKRDKTRRKVIFVISDGREYESRASYRSVLKVLQTRNIQVRAVVVDTGALPVYKQVERFRIKGTGYDEILPRYTHATGGGDVLTELSRNSIEDAYADIASDARNQYTLAYTPKSTAGPAYRSIDVQVDRKGLKVYAKDGYYPVPSAR